MSWSIKQIAQDAIAPLFNSDSSSTSSSILDFFLPKSRQAPLQPGGTRRFYSGYSQQQVPPNSAMQIMGTVQSLLKGLHTTVQVVSGIGNQIGVLLHNPTQKKVQVGHGHHIFRAMLKTVTKVVPDILPLLAEKDNQNKNVFGQLKKTGKPFRQNNNLFAATKKKTSKSFQLNNQKSNIFQSVKKTKQIKKYTFNKSCDNNLKVL